MRSYSGVIKIVLTIAFFMVALFVFTGCATLETEMNLNTGFVGERTMNVSVPQEDMSEKITGGEEAFDAVVNTNLPAELTVQKNYDSENSVFIYSFTLEFSSLEDYTAKVNALLVKGENGFDPRIVFDEFDSEFKTGLALSENFSSGKLMRWLSNALVKADIVNDNKNYQLFSEKMPTLIYNGQERTLHEDSYYRISTDEMVYNTFEDIVFETKLESDGTFVRKINFVMAGEVIQRLKTTKDIAVSAYFSTLVDELGEDVATFEETVDSEKATVTYALTIKAVNQDELIKYTNIIMKNEKTEFSVAIVSSEATGGAVVTTSEMVDASYYLNYNVISAPKSVLKMYQGCVFRGDGGPNVREITYPDRRTEYWLYLGERMVLQFDWEVMFPEVELVLTMGGQIKAELSLRISEKADKVFLDSIKKQMQKFEPVEGKMTSGVKDGNLVYTIDFGSGTNREISTKVTAFLLEYANHVGKGWLVPKENELILYYGENIGTDNFFSKDYTMEALFRQNIFSEYSNTVVVRTGFGASFIEEETEKEKELVFTSVDTLIFLVEVRQVNVVLVIGLLLAVVALAVVLIIVAGRMGKKRKMKALTAGMYQPTATGMQQPPTSGMQQGVQQQIIPSQAQLVQNGGAMLPMPAPLDFSVVPTAEQALARQEQVAPPQTPQMPQGQDPQATKMFIVPEDDMYEKIWPQTPAATGAEGEKIEQPPQPSTETAEPPKGE